MKYVALAAIVVGIAMVLYGFASSHNLSFDDGGFMVQMLILVTGIGIAAIGGVTLSVMAFLAIP